MEGLPKVGDLVRVSLGIDQVEGKVVEVWGLSLGGRITVEIKVEGEDEPIFPSYPVKDVELLEAA